MRAWNANVTFQKCTNFECTCWTKCLPQVEYFLCRLEWISPLYILVLSLINPDSSNDMQCLWLDRQTIWWYFTTWSVLDHTDVAMYSTHNRHLTIAAFTIPVSIWFCCLIFGYVHSLYLLDSIMLCVDTKIMLHSILCVKLPLPNNPEQSYMTSIYRKAEMSESLECY